MKRHYGSNISVLLVVILVSTTANAAPQVEIVIDPAAPKLERFAGDELAAKLRMLVDAEVSISNEPQKDRQSILMGSPATNPVVRAACGDNWPQMSDQGHLLRTVNYQGRSMLVVGGSTPQATLWAAYELLHRFGIRSLLQGDFLPVERRPFTVEGFDVVLQPTVKTRAWQLLDGGATGWEAWGPDDYRRLLRQLAKLKFNHVLLAIGPTQPFLHYHVKDVPKKTGELFSGRTFSVGGDTAGRKAFQGVTSFENPALSGSKSYGKRMQAGMALVVEVIDMAHESGFRVGVQLSPLDFPPEIAESLAGADNSRRLNASLDQLHSCLRTYPQIDSIHLTLPEERAFAEQAQTTWQKEIPRNPNIAKLAAVHPLKVYFNGPTEMNLLIPVELSRKSAGVLPQLLLAPLPKWIDEARKPAREGWVARAGLPSDAELATYFLARSAFDATLTPQQTTDELIATVAGPGIPERLMKGFDMIEQATQLIDKHDREFATPDPKMVLQHAKGGEPAPPWWTEVQTLYTEAMNEMYRGNTRAREGGRDFILYYARRYEFGLTYMASLDALRQSAVAKSKGDVDAQRQHLESSVESMYNALGAFSEVARDPSDRGVIAVLNEFGYRPLMSELQALDSK